MSKLLEEIVYRISIRTHSAEAPDEIAHRPTTFSAEKYRQWREQELLQQFETSFDWSSLAGKRVLDFGCGTGELSLAVRKKGATCVVGTDLSEELVAAARDSTHDSGIQFLSEPDSKRISLPDESVDVVLCFDSLEHIMDFQEIMQEWHRVLSPGGSVLIWWCVWWHPYGHHLQTLIPIPWVHVLLSDASLMRVCERIYDSPHFKPRIWHFGSDGTRKNNPFTGISRFDDLNKLTIQKFKKEVIAAGFSVRRLEIHPFSGRWQALKKLLVRLPWPDFFCSCVVSEIQKPRVT